MKQVIKGLTKTKGADKLNIMTTMMNSEKTNLRYIPFKCPNCNGYKTVSYGKRICPVCKGKGFLVIDQETGLPVNNDDDGEKQK